jgi:hypothetical protein
MGNPKGVTGNPYGRPKGTPNRTTQQAKELLEQIMFGQIDNINEALDNLKEKDYSRYLDACSKLFTYVLPKKTDITSDGKAIIPEMPTVIVKTKNGSD